MDYIVINIMSIVKRKRTNCIRKIMSATFGALYSIVIIKLLFYHLSNTMFLNIIVAAVMVIIAFGYTDICTYLKNVLLLFGISFTMSGAINYLYYSTIMGKYIRSFIIGNSNKVVNARRFIITTFLAYILLNAIVKAITMIRKDNILYYDVKITFRGKSIIAKALLDTGNSLTEPITGNIVHLAEYKILKPILEGDEEAKEKLCVIPFHSVGEENGIMYGIRVDEMVVLVNGEPEFVHNPIIGIYKGNMSAHKKYSVILNRDVFEIMK
jgi:stage II sporulation protein GA (sporulation sigma-E factor processing peptidase)